MTNHVLVDFGEVISHVQSPAAMRTMAELLGVPARAFTERYWGSRASYDRGLAAYDYWQLVAGRPVRGEELLLLRRLDVEGWTRLNFETIAVLREARRRGAQLTLLSNAPSDLAVEVRASSVLAEIFTLMVFSAELRLAKPDGEIFDTALALAESTPQDTLFVDDRWENIRAAGARGIRTHRFTTAQELQAVLAGIHFGDRQPRPWWTRRRAARSVSAPG
ncbi:HAD-IA family hydrolase [Microbacterium saperdae]|uniref:Putative hydrolase of the HAD superfamily n=1 Tax=Microbacterium saperdae TaxID=69368 RepID=A0A543B9Z7_9MICO|nr:HAD-IA family hydrolase [Microbacterium saperdae]TQL81667.1 putative hydrolase of the HAD superfamily [Microbacterium saperdae]GGM33843.1 haloacid dehalogenase [Microbacterium saperdae]